MKLAIKILLLALVTSCTPVKDTTIQEVTPQKTTISDIKNIKYANNSIVLLVPITGSHKALGINVLNACILGNQNSDMDIFVIDTNDYPDTLQQSKFKNLRAAIGPVFYRETHKFASIFQKVPLFSLSNNIEANNTHIYACGLAPQEEINTIFRYMRQHHLSSLTVLLPNGEFFSNIEKIVQRESIKYNFNEDNLTVIHYDSSANLAELVQDMRSSALFVMEPIKSSNTNVKVFTLSSLALSQPAKWEGVLFAYADNMDQKSFIEAYQRTFNTAPTVISLAAYDIVKMINEASVMHKDMFDESYEGTLGSFKIKKGKGIARNLSMFSMLHGEKVLADID